MTLRGVTMFCARGEEFDHKRTHSLSKQDTEQLLLKEGGREGGREGGGEGEREGGEGRKGGREGRKEERK